MRRSPRLLLAAVALVGLAAGCSGDDAGGDGGQAVEQPATGVRPDAPLPAELAAFLDQVAEPGEVPFRATYRVLVKLGGRESVVEVVADPPSWQVQVGDVIVVEGPEPATCRISAERCVGQVREELLAPAGVFSRFFATAPARVLATDARRPAAGDVERTEREVAGVPLQCAGVPLGGNVASRACLTPEGVFGWVDTPAVHYELTDYQPGPPEGPVRVPYELTADDAFLQEG